MSGDDRSWYGDGYPELRDGPPWVMEDMILAEPGLAPAIASAPGAEAIAGAVLAAAHAGRPIVVTGCGTSEHGALAVAALLDDALRRAGVAALPESRQALDAALDPRAGGLCIGISHDGTTRATILALEAARTAGAATATIGVGRMETTGVGRGSAGRGGCSETVPAAGTEGVMGGVSASAIVSAASTGVITLALAG